MPNRTDELDGASSLPPNGTSARERALRLNRGIIGLCVAVLLAIFFMPV